MNAKLRSRLEEQIGAPIRSARSLAGGDICQAFLVAFDDGSEVFVKTRQPAPEGMFPAEARGLKWLGEIGVLRIPEVVASSLDFLVLEYLRSASCAADFDDTLGVGLAAMHRYSVQSYGLDHDNFIGPLVQVNGARPTWVEFFIEQRLRPQLELAISLARAPRDWAVRFQGLFKAIPSLIPQEPPSRLHGDLWGGNLMVGPGGEPCLVDPAAYAGHREVDLAMMRLFGGFSQRVFDAYHGAYPLQDGHLERVELYQLYPLLVHVNLFGGGYVSSVGRILEKLTFGHRPGR